MEKYMLTDIAGYEEEKEELAQIIAMFRDFKEYQQKGVYLSKGLIISGSPGVGKTLFARVLANEINAPFFYIDGAEYSGVRGVRKLKAVFRTAHKKSPSVIFIDELNAFVGGYDYRSDNTKRNLSALLKLIDGIKNNAGVFVIGASSDKDDLDEAIVRSGRMDKHICLDSPSHQSRRAILDYYLSNVTFDTSTINKKLIAEKTQGFNGADIKTLVNETMLECIYKKTPPTDDLFMQHIHRIEEKDINREQCNRDLALLACHDIGHMIVSHALLKQYDDISLEYESDKSGNTSIVSLFSANDYDDDDDDDDTDYSNSFDSLKVLLDKICVLLGGSAAEEVLLGEKYMTSYNDIEKAVKLIDVAFQNGLMGFEYTNHNTYYYVEVSQRLLSKMVNKRVEILTEQYQRAKDIVTKNQEKLMRIQDALVQKKSLSKTEIFEFIK